jgi:EAL domain-containing protein (putative c-di-GMP-specific phosphodiesterase class I)
VEALVEWSHPQRGRLGASRFIPIAEEAGVIEELGAWVFLQAARTHQQWRKSGLEAGRLALNVSPYQVCRSGFAGRILDLLAESGLPPGSLELEITENRLLSDVGEACRRLDRLRAEGVSICLDDFGAGYSSLRLLRLLPLDGLKIDRSVVATVNDPGGVQLVRAYLELARHHRLRVVAEGVETARQLETLVSLGCDEAQGYFIAPPLSSSALEAFLRERPGHAQRAEA